LQELPNITEVKTTSDGQYAVITTAEDKTVRVFAVSSDGQLDLISRRYKRLEFYHIIDLTIYP
jgi:hypothetical protein